MTTKSEDVLLQMGGVRYKKGDGTLYVMNERIAWMAENRDKVAVAHRFQDIKSKANISRHLPHKRLPRNILRTNLNIFIPDYLFAVQKISPEGKPKVQLQVVLHDNNNTTFHFVNRNGMEAQIQDRDKVKELLQQLLPNFKRKVDKELEEKNRYGYLISC